MGWRRNDDKREGDVKVHVGQSLDSGLELSLTSDDCKRDSRNMHYSVI